VERELIQAALHAGGPGSPALLFSRIGPQELTDTFRGPSVRHRPLSPGRTDLIARSGDHTIIYRVGRCRSFPRRRTRGYPRVSNFPRQKTRGSFPGWIKAAYQDRLDGSLPALTSTTVESFEEYTHHVHGIGMAAAGPQWYRGSARASHVLVPGLFRHPNVTNVDELLGVERELVGWFTLRSPPYLTRELRDQWDRLFLMQHYRVPTRLLDWTESPFTALYFALRDPPPDPPEDAVIWRLDPGAWNAKVFARTGLPRTIFSPGDADPDRLLDGYSTEKNVQSVLPAAILGAHNNPRIVAQRGTFVIFGRDLRPMEQVYTTENFPADVLTRIVIPRAKCPQILASLRAIGVTDSLIFPDLEGLAREARQKFGFEGR
jgi:hypothetical protein